MAPSDESPTFLFATCQVGAERALKAEIARAWPEFRFSFSRPGFLTFKLPSGHALADDFELHSIFARAYGFSLGKIAGENLAELADAVWQLALPKLASAQIHVWQRDPYTPGFRGFEPGVTPIALEAETAIERRRPEPAGKVPEKPTAIGELVLDCVMVEPRLWWVGYHRAHSIESCWPGGICEITLPPEAVSRAFVKMEEALRWSELSLKPNDLCAELGCAPGGSSQALLTHGVRVLGIDPAEVDPRLLANSGFTHVRKRGADLKRREFRDVRWLAADINAAPSYTLDTVEPIVTHSEVHIEGLILTLKLLDWKLAEEIPAYLERITGWGFADVRARQLGHNRQEICVAALRKRRNKRAIQAPSRRKRTRPGLIRKKPART